ncbi:MAG: iron-sulfur cluster assembly scaffold protein [Patescibacteria group bacterium]|nr:iron-sulfur cluster assembly scaffold protein [Patescibacteria group bacterium]MDE2438290.1 iron-sulfur cluster assembly scaffold protein [Patescibacteria group bacterium]
MTYQQYLSKYKLNKLPHEHVLSAPTRKISRMNDMCGDGLTFYFLIEEGEVKDIGFDGYGCFLSRLASSLLAKKCIGKPVAELKEWNRERLLKLLGFPVEGVREECVLIPLRAFQSFRLKK